jgi:hypothetical protein
MNDRLPMIPQDCESLDRLLGLYDAPAFVRRGLRLAQAIDQVYERCTLRRQEWLRGAAIHLRTLRRAIPDWMELRHHWGSDQEFQTFLALLPSLIPTPPPLPPRPLSQRQRYQVLCQLTQSLQRFNRRWQAFVRELDLSEVNRQIADYNRYYLLEKECAVRSARIAQRGFRPAQAITHDEIFLRFPLLPIPRLLER